QRTRGDEQVEPAVGHLPGDGIARGRLALGVVEGDVGRFPIAVALRGQTVEDAAHTVVQDRDRGVLEDGDPRPPPWPRAAHVRRQEHGGGRPDQGQAESQPLDGKPHALSPDTDGLAVYRTRKVPDLRATPAAEAGGQCAYRCLLGTSAARTADLTD